MSTAIYEDGELKSADDTERIWKERIEAGLRYRKGFEPTWLSCMAFAAGQQWLQWDPQAEQLVLPDFLAGVDYYTADYIGEFRDAALGEMSQDDDRPQLQVVTDDQFGDDVGAQANRDVAHGWVNEWGSDAALAEARRYCVDLGTSAIRTRFDKYAGPVMQNEVPFQGGKPLLDPEQAHAYVADTAAQGGQADLRTINEGRTTWEPLSAFNLIVPPGVPHERDFPWEIVVRPVTTDALVDEFGAKARTVKEDTDIASVFGTSTRAGDTGLASNSIPIGSKRSRLTGHCWLYTCYERPCRRYQKGRIVVLAGGAKTLLDIASELEYERPDGTHTSGISYYHWKRVSGRFYSRGLVEPMKDPQRFINRRKTQNGEIIDRAMPYTLVDAGSMPEKPNGMPMEFVEIDMNKYKPAVPVQGSGPGPWMYSDMETLISDLEHVTGIRAVSLGENPSGVDTYSGLVRLQDQEGVKRELIYKEHRASTAHLVECSVCDIKRYWPDGKQIMLASDEEQAQAVAFNAATWKDLVFKVSIPPGSARPRGQAANAILIEQIWKGSIDSGMPLPLEWYKASLEAGQPLDLPDLPGNAHRDKALEENHKLLQGEFVQAADYDPPEVHIPIHNEAQLQADLTGDMIAWKAIDAHKKAHLAAAAINAMKLAQVSPESVGVPSAAAGGPPGGNGTAPAPGPAPPPAPISAPQ